MNYALTLRRHPTPWHLLIAALSLSFPILLYRARHLDDNSLTSWQWVFIGTDPWQLWLALLVLSPFFWLLAITPNRRLGGDKRPGLATELTLAPPRQPGPKIGVGPLTRFLKHLSSRTWASPHRHRLGPPLAAFLACLLFLDTPEVIVDAARYFVQAKSLSEYGLPFFFRQWGIEIFAWTDLPLIPMLYGLLFSLFGESRLAVQLLNALFLALSTMLIAQLGRDLWDEETGQAAAWLLLGIPYIYSQTPLIMVDIGTMFFLTLALAGFHRALTRGGGYIALTALAVVAVLLSKYSAWLLLSGLLPIFCYSLGADRRTWQIRQTWRQVIARAALALLPALIVSSWLFWEYRTVMAEQITLLLEFQRPALITGFRESLVSTFFFQIHPLVTAALLYSLYRAIKRRDLRYLLVAWLVVLLLVILGIERIRYSVPIFPLLALLAGYGLRDLVDSGLRRHLLLVIVGSSLLLAKGAFLPFLQGFAERNIQEAGHLLDTLGAKQATIVVAAEAEEVLDPRIIIPMLDLFTSTKLLAQPELKEPEPPPWAAKSPLRFSWEMPLPPFYFTTDLDQPQPEILVLIKGSPAAVLPPELSFKLQNFHKLKHFTTSNSIFQHDPRVMIYILVAEAPGPNLGLADK